LGAGPAMTMAVGESGHSLCPLLSKALSSDRFVESVTSGKDNMPSWYGVLKDDEIEAIWSYIRAMVDK
jgi:mono/diheme cytochrome c family protein